MENKIQKIKCPLCGSVVSSKWGRKNNFDLYRCDHCKLIFVYPIPNSFSLYNEDYFSGAEDGFGYVNYDSDKEPMIPTFEKYLGLCEKFGKKNGNLLDIGAATGFFMSIAKSRGFAVSGVEISAFAANIGRKKGLNISVGDILSNQKPENFFDVVTMFDVLEHMTNPFREMLEARLTLKSGGLLVINTPNGQSLLSKIMKTRWHLVVPPEHLFYFSPQNLSEYLGKNGFEILYTGSVSKKFTFSYIFKTLHKWQKISLWNYLANFFAKKYPKLSIPINLKDNFLLIAKKQDEKNI